MALSGYSYAVSALLGTVHYSELGLPSAKAKEVLALGQKFIEIGLKAKEGDKMALTYINGGWALIGSFISLGKLVVQLYAVRKLSRYFHLEMVISVNVATSCQCSEDFLICTVHSAISFDVVKKMLWSPAQPKHAQTSCPSHASLQ